MVRKESNLPLQDNQPGKHLNLLLLHPKSQSHMIFLENIVKMSLLSQFLYYVLQLNFHPGKFVRSTYFWFINNLLPASVLIFINFKGVSSPVNQFGVVFNEVVKKLGLFIISVIGFARKK